MIAALINVWIVDKTLIPAITMCIVLQFKVAGVKGVLSSSVGYIEADWAAGDALEEAERVLL